MHKSNLARLVINLLEWTTVVKYPEVMAPFVGVFEIVCGAPLILGLLTRLAAIP